MNKNKLSNPVRLIAFFLTAVLLICTFGFTVDGWQINFPSNKDQSSAQLPEQVPDSSVENQIPEENEPNQEPETPEIPDVKYYNRITGLECTEQISSNSHLAFVMNPQLPSYGVSDADLLCEVPTEEGATRYVAFIPEIDNLWKIGSITPTRGYINNLIKYFGGICVSNGNDDSFIYSSCDITANSLDLSPGYQYTEFTDNVYTNRDLLISAINNSGIDRTSVSSPMLPYEFIDIGGDNIVLGDTNAQIISIAHSEKNLTELHFNSETRKYVLYKNGSEKLDAINNKTIEFTNCFVLFADSVTYDNPEYSQMVMDTIGEGVGYYFTEGGIMEINWVGSSDGSLTFYNKDGGRLTVNRGNGYITFIKSSKQENLSYK